MELAHEHHLPTSELSSWAPDDLGNALALLQVQNEECSRCHIHPSLWNPLLGGRRNAVRVRWRHCAVCEQIDIAEESGPPTEDKGWHMELVFNPT